jgi:peroxiredoxin (alkyl hydroperoxide reductase subunit C)
MNPQQIKSLSAVGVGGPAPEFLADAYMRGAVEPQPLSLAQFRGTWLVLLFYPRDFTFVCPTELQALATLETEFDRKGASIVAASTDSFYSHKAWFESDARLREAGYPVIADTSHELSAAYGVLLPDGSALRAAYVIDPEGIVRHVPVTDLNVGRNVDETLRVFEALRTGELCPVNWRPGEPTLAAA